MRPPRPLGRIRLLTPILGRGRRRRRGGPLVPMIWRRRLRASAAPPQKAIRPVLFAPTYAFSLTQIWPAGTAARAEKMRGLETRSFETRLRETFRAGRDLGAGEASRLVMLVERLWLHSVKTSPPGAVVSPFVDARQRALRSSPVRQDGPDFSRDRDSGIGESRRRVTLSEGLWLRSVKGSPPSVAAPSPMDSPQPALATANREHAARDASTPQGSRPAPAQGEIARRLWPRAGTAAAAFTTRPRRVTISRWCSSPSGTNEGIPCR